MNENIKMNSLFVKQRSEEWFAIHKQTKVTGSSIGKAIDLQGLAQQKIHHTTNVLNKSYLQIPPEVQIKMDHGTNFEKHGLATLCGQIMPALLPPCYCFFEVGTKSHVWS